MKKVILHSKDQLENYRSKYQGISNNKIDFSYLERSKVCGIIDNQKLVAGCCICHSGDLRYFRDLPIDPENPMHNEDLYCEMTCIWISRDVPQIYRIYVYFSFLIEAHKTGKKYILGGARVKKIMEIQTQSMPYLLHYEKNNVSAQATGEELWLYYGTMMSTLKGFFFGALERLIVSVLVANCKKSWKNFHQLLGIKKINP